MKKSFSEKKETKNNDVPRPDAANVPAGAGTETQQPPKKKITYTKLFIRDFSQIILCTLIPIILFGKVWGISICPSASMYPAIRVGEIYIMNRLVAQDVQERGTIITFWNSDHTQPLCKRIIGVPGDTIAVDSGKVYINGEELDESGYLEPGVTTDGNIEVTIPEGRYFVMGDNRNNSYDSRYWLSPLIHQEDITGVYMFGIYIPLFSPALASFITGEAPQ